MVGTISGALFELNQRLQNDYSGENKYFQENISKEQTLPKNKHFLKRLADSKKLNISPKITS